MYDQHVHTCFSYDCREGMENYLKLALAGGDKMFVTTEHMDLESHFSGSDLVPDFDRLKGEIKRLRELYPIDILLGIEAGYRPDIKTRVLKGIKSQPFDIVLLSVHEGEREDISKGSFGAGLSADECYDKYLDMMTDAAENVKDYDVFAHVDYCIRYRGQVDMEKHREKLTRLLTTIADDGKALELNTRTVHQYGTMYYVQYALELFLSCGGKKVTVGSDAHSTHMYKRDFDKVLSLLREKGVRNISAYKERCEILLPIE